MKRIIIFFAFLFPLISVAQKDKLPLVIAPKFKKDSFNIKKFGAIADGHFLNTKSIQNAIEALAKKGGGVIIVPAGLWLTGPIVLKSNINLHLANGATLLFTADKKEYPIVAANWEGLPQMRNQSPISATGASNIAITGKGIIDGNGDGWRLVKKDKLNETQWKKLVASGGVLSEDKKTWFPSEQFMKANKLSNPGQISPEKDAAYYENIKDFLRPNLVLLTNCKYILLEGVTFQNSAAWCLHPLMSEHLTVRNITVKNPWYAQNGDGIDVESCKNVLIENSIFDVGDDALCMKSGRDEEGRKRAMPTENVTIRGCTVYSSHGGFVIGSEMSGGARNIHVSNCTFIGADIGLRFKTTRGRGGIVENIFIKDIYMKDIPGEAILFDMYYAAKDPIPLAGEKRELPKIEFLAVDETTPVFRNFHISNVYVSGAEKAIFIRGLPEKHVSEIVLENMVLQAKKGIDIQEASNIIFKNIQVISDETNPVIDIIQSDKLVFDNISFSKNTQLLFRLNGERTKTVHIKNTDVSNAKEKIKYELGATEKNILFEIKPVATLPLNKISEAIAKTIMNTWVDSFALDGKPAKWTYDMGVILKGFEGLWLNTGDVKYFNYIQKQMDFFIKDDGSIKTYKQDEFNIDNINNGKLLMLLYRVTLKDKYLKAARLLREQLQHHPRTVEGSFWHKKIYPNQVWLDGLYMSQPFFAEYALYTHEDAAFNDIADQFMRIENHARDTKTGLLYHAWDESKQMKWADPVTGCSPLFWSRAMGWFANALVDVLDYFPKDHAKRKELIAILNRLANAVEKVQDKETGLWLDILSYNGPGKEKNYFEASASSQFVYAIAKGVRKGYLPAAKISIAKNGYAGLVNKFIKTENLPTGQAGNQTNLYGTVKVSGLGGNPYRDGSFEYYMSEPVIMNDPKGIGAFLLASNEMDMLPTLSIGKTKSVVMDNYFNRETKVDAFGNKVVFHYKWWEKDNGGFSLLGHVFNKHGVETKTLNDAPTAENLKNASIYFLIDPDWPKENKTPNYIEQKHIDALYNYVQNGGVLVMMANDSNNVEFKHFNELAEKFGIHWNENMRHDVIDNKYEQGALPIAGNNPIFKTAKKVFIKQLCTQDIKSPATSVYSENGEVLMSVSKIGKGTVFAVGDPWFYNEYVDGRKIPVEYENYKAAEDLVKWLINKAVIKN